tara:strand:- start:160 stop:387 length:228 start_codon:yes stop_codon:yes gene_type:complete
MRLFLHQQIETDNTLLTPITAEIAEGMIARDKLGLESENRLKFPHPFQIPPMVDDLLSAVDKRFKFELRSTPSSN